jgi:predicted transposase YdaD
LLELPQENHDASSNFHPYLVDWQQGHVAGTVQGVVTLMPADDDQISEETRELIARAQQAIQATREDSAKFNEIKQVFDERVEQFKGHHPRPIRRSQTTRDHQ